MDFLVRFVLIMKGKKETEDYPMKKLFTVLIAIVLLAAICTTAVAMGRRNFVDTDSNGICDNKDNTVCGNGYGNYVDTDSNGICDNRDNTDCGNGYGNYVDTDNNGICDNRANNHHGNGKHNGRGKHCA